MAQLEYLSGEKSPILLEGAVVIGRSADHADVAINDQRLSRKHCKIAREGDVFVVHDLESRNGTKVNNVAIKRCELKDGDEISLGGVKLRYASTDGASDPHFAETLMTTVHSGTPQASSVSMPATVPCLKLLKGTLRSVLIPLENFPVTVGRKPGNTIVLEDDRQSSSRHARFELDKKGNVVLIDLQSTNGTKIDGKRIDRVVLEDGMRIQLGSQTFRFDLGQSANDSSIEAPQELTLDEDEDGLHSGEDEDEFAGESDHSAEADADIDSPEEASEERERIAGIAVDTEGSGRGKLLVRVLEATVVVLVLAAIGAFVFFAQGEEIHVGGGGSGTSSLPVLPGGLLTKNPSFETDGRPGSDGRMHLWQSVSTAREDSVVGIAEQGVGGSQVMRVERFAAARTRTLWVCRERFAAPAQGGFEASVWVKMPRDSGSAFLFMEWFVGDEDLVALRRDYRGYSSGHKEWTQIKADFIPPVGASFARVGVGVTGKAGVVLFDQARVTRNDALESPTLKLGTSNHFQLGDDGTLSLFGEVDGKQAPLFVSGSVELSTSNQTGLSIPHHEWLVEQPKLRITDGGAELRFLVFDPDAEQTRELTLELNASQLRASAQDVAGSSLSALRFVATATDRLMPSGIVVLQDGRPLHWGSQVVSNIADNVVFVDVADRYRLSADAYIAVSGAQLKLFGHQGRVEFTLHVEQEDAAYHDLMELATQGSQAEQIGASLRLVSSYTYDLQAVQRAQQALGSAANAYRIKHIELRDVVRHSRSLTGSEDLFLRSVNRINQLHRELTENMSLWNDLYVASEIESLASNRVVPAAFKEALSEINQAMQIVRTTREAFGIAATNAEQARIQLLAARQQIESESALKSALDHLSSEELVQAELKLRAIIRHYPYSYSATVARSRLVEIANAIYAEYQTKAKQSLGQIATELRNRGLGVIDFVMASRLQAGVFKALRHAEAMPLSFEKWQQEEEALTSEAERVKEDFERR